MYPLSSLQFRWYHFPHKYNYNYRVVILIFKFSREIVVPSLIVKLLVFICLCYGILLILKNEDGIKPKEKETYKQNV